MELSRKETNLIISSMYNAVLYYQNEAGVYSEDIEYCTQIDKRIKEIVALINKIEQESINKATPVALKLSPWEKVHQQALKVEMGESFDIPIPTGMDARVCQKRITVALKRKMLSGRKFSQRRINETTYRVWRIL